MDEGSHILPVTLQASKATPAIAFISLARTLCEWGVPELIELIELEADPFVDMWHAKVSV